MPTAPVTHGHLYYEEQGSGELIILLPGLGHDHTYFAKTLPLIAAAGHVVAPDPRGLGLSSPAQSYSVEQWAADVLELIAHFRVPHAHLVGSSLGACVCMQAALDQPAAVASLTLVAGFSEVDPLLEMNFRTRLKILDEAGLGDLMASHEDIMTPPALSAQMAQRISGAELRVIPQCGHITFTEQPQATSALILKFLRGAMNEHR